MLSGAHRRASRPALVLLQILVFVTYIFGPTAAFAEEPTPEPTPTESVAPEPSTEPTPEPTPDPTSEPTAAPTISSDKPDYAPGELVTVTGSRWAPGELVHIRVNDNQGETWRRDVDVIAGTDGRIADEFNLPTWFVAMYFVTASGPISGTAQTTFTDANLKVNGSFVGSTTDTYTLKYSRYSDPGCAGTLRNGDPSTQLVGIAAFTVPPAGQDSAILEAAATSTQGRSFVNWTDPDGVVVSTTSSYCADFPPGGTDKTYTANYGLGNRAPLAVNDTYAATEDTTLNVVAPGVLGNDTDADGNSLTAILVAGPTAAQGTLTLNANGSFSFAPASNFNGAATFTYKANDGTADSNVATVTINVAAVNDAPVLDLNGADAGIDDTAAFTEDGLATTLAPEALVSDVDNANLTSATVALTNHPDGSAESLSITGCNPAITVSAYNATTGVLALNGWASLADYQACLRTVQYNNTDQDPSSTDRLITFTVNDGALSSPVAKVTLTVTPVNDAPTCADDSGSTAEDTTLNDTLLCADVDNATLTYTRVTNAAHGNVTVNLDGTFSYVPAANYNGPDSFTFRANDGTVNSNTAIYSITVTPVNDAPVVEITAGPQLVDESVSSARTYTFVVSDVDAGDTFSVVSGYPDCGEAGVYVAFSLTPSGTGGTFQCRFPDGDASTTISIQVKDSADALSNTATRAVTIENVAPTVAFTAGPISVNESGTAEHTYSYSISDPGDDTVQSVSTSCGANGDKVPASDTNTNTAGSFKCIFDDGDASSTVSVQATDSDGEAGNTATRAVTIENVAPVIGAATVAVDPISGVVTGYVDWTDPGADSETVVFEYLRDGVSVGTNTYSAKPANGSQTDTRTQLAPGCFTLEMIVRVTDDDNDFDQESRTTTSVDVFLATFDAPIKENERNIAKYGNVIPVKVRLASSCTGVATNTPELYITVAKGTTLETYDDEILITSVSSADSDNHMLRTAGPKYMYNLSTKGAQWSPNTNHEIRIRVGSTTGPIIARAVIYPKK